MSQKLLYLTSFVLVLALAGANVAFGVTVEVRTAGSHEGVEEHINGGSIARSSSDLEMPYEDSGTPPSDPQLVALRFQNVNVPPGAVIENAYVQFLADNQKLTGGPVNLIIWGQKELNPINFTSDTNFMVSTAPRTEAIAKWSNIPDWTSSEANLASRTADISIVIQELIDQPGWAAGDVLIIIIGDDPDNPSQSIRSAQSWDGNSTDAPLLHIEWSRGPATFPSPDDGQTDVLRNVVLSWKPGPYAAPINGHKVYLSESFDDVSNGIGGITQSTTSYAPPQRLEFSTTYYWRVDEVNNVNPNSPWISRVWSFTTELFAYPIDGNNITATASGTGQPGMDPENTINGSGLDVNDLHSMDAAAMWLSSDEPNAWIEYELDKAHKLYEMWVWNSNQTIESLVGFGFKDVTIEYSVDGNDYTTLGTTHEFVRAPGAADYAHNTTVDFGGAAAKYIRLTANSNWGGMLDQYGLSEVRFFHIPVHATEPYPDSGTADVDIDVVLGFRAGREAVEHNVYLSTDEQAVIDSNALVTTVTDASYSPLSLDLGTTYYWKINEVNEAETPATWESDIWSFTTTDHIIVDDFEDYNDYPPNEIWFTWIDGYGVPANGSTVGYPDPDWNQGEHYVETAIVHGGDQAMPFFYSNTGGAAYSEGERTFAVPQDWTAASVQTLALHFSGTSGNTGQLYVKVNGTKVSYDGQASNLALAGWQAWNIELASFGTNLQSVTTLAIGIDGNGASGTLYFDDIRLYARSREFITPAEPSSVGLIGHWKFDGDTLDSSGLGNGGTAGGNPTFVAGKVGSNAIELDGDDYVVIDAVADDITDNDITLSAWVKTTDSSADWFSCNTSGLGNVVRFVIQDTKAAFDTDSEHALSNTAVNDDQWHLLTFVRSGDTGYVYVDGVMENSYAAAFSFSSNDLWSIGQEWDSGGPSGFLTGIVDDVRIYDYALSLGEVAWLAGRTEPFDKPF